MGNKTIKHDSDPLNTKLIFIFFAWCFIGLIMISEILSGQSDPIGVLPFVWAYYLGIWAVSGFILVIGISAFYETNKFVGIIIGTIALGATYPVTNKYSKKTERTTFVQSVKEGDVSLDSLVDEWKLGNIPAYKLRGIEIGLKHEQNISENNLEWVISHCLKKNDDCHLEVWHAFNNEYIKPEQIVLVYNNLKKNGNNPCKKAGIHSKNLINYPLTPIDILYDLRNYCSDQYLKELNKEISKRELLINKT